MANILLTKYCNRNCKYCFAQAKLTGAADDNNINMENFEQYLAMLKRSRMLVVALLGGETSLHPRFTEILDKCQEDDYFKVIKVFTNGLMPDHVIEHLQTFPRDKIQIALNIHPEEDYTPGQWQRITKVLTVLNDKAGLGYNIYKTGNHFEFLLKLYLEYGLFPHVRLGLTQPIMGVSNAHLAVEDFPAIGREIVNIVHEFTSKGLFLSFDCGFPFCMFTLDQHKELLDCAIKFRSLCSPIIDVDPKLNAWRCFPLSQVDNIQMNDFETRMDMVRYYGEKLKPYRQFGIYDKCVNCNYKKQELCCGGCLGRVMRAFNRN